MSSGIRKKYTLSYKLGVVQNAEATSNRAAARTHLLDESLVRCLRKMKNKLKAEDNRRRLEEIRMLDESVEDAKFFPKFWSGFSLTGLSRSVNAVLE